MIKYLTAGESHGPQLTGIIEGIPQKISCGKQYFKMHSRLLEIAEAKLNKTFRILN